MDHAKLARELFLQGYNCAQSVFGAFTDVTGMDLDMAMKVASSFGGGMGRMREVCGACSGVFMTAGFLFGGYDPNDRAAKAAHYVKIQELAARFREKNGSIICRELLKGAETSPVPEGRSGGYYKKRPCADYVEDAAVILDAMLKEKAEEK